MFVLCYTWQKQKQKERKSQSRWISLHCELDLVRNIFLKFALRAERPLVLDLLPAGVDGVASCWDWVPS